MRYKRMLWVVAALAGFAFARTQAVAEDVAKPKGKYIGVANCGKCHKSSRKGDQLGKWEESKHAQAYKALASDAAKELGKKMNIADPQKSDKCLKCHTTAHGVDASMIEPIPEGKKGHDPADGVGCEACHGPGSEYSARKVMKDHDAAVASGLIVPDEKRCKGCHVGAPEGPMHKKEFDFAKMVVKVQHPNPLNAK